MVPYLTKKDKTLCCSCRACEQKCPQKCISMEESGGFYYPVVDKEKCTNCGLCGKVCQYNKQGEGKREDFTVSVYAAWNKDEELVSKSSSGAIFPTVAKYVISSGGVVFGARFTEDFSVVIDCAETFEDCFPFRKSKYVFSNTMDSYSRVLKYLKDGRLVLFTGSPCQVSGLLSFLGKKWDNLITMDFVCHGFPSELVLKSFIKQMEAENESKVVKLDFRHKKENDDTPYLLMDYENGKSHVLPLSDSLYGQTYFCHIPIMPACNKCLYTKTERVSDFTVGDFQGVKEVFPEGHHLGGTSVLLINTAKGEEVFSQIKDELTLRKADMNKATAHNPPLRIQAGYNPLSKRFMKAIRKKSFSHGFNKYVKYGNIIILPYRICRKVVRKIIK